LRFAHRQAGDRPDHLARCRNTASRHGRRARGGPAGARSHAGGRQGDGSGRKPRASCRGVVGKASDPFSQARSMYVPSAVSTLMRSPLLMNGGTCTVMPVSIFAGLNVLVAVAFLMPGSVSTTVRITEGGISTPMARPLEVDLDVGIGQKVARLALEEVGLQREL